MRWNGFSERHDLCTDLLRLRSRAGALDAPEVSEAERESPGAK